MKTKKIIVVSIITMCITFLCGISRTEARTIYVSPTGASTGEGATEAAPVSHTRLWDILNTMTFATGDNTLNVYFAGGVYNGVAPLGAGSGTNHFNRTAFNGKTVNFLGTGTWDNPAIFDGNGTNNQMLNLTSARSAANLFIFTMRNIIMRNFVDTSNNNNMFVINDGYNRVTIDSVTITACHNPGARIFHLNETNSALNISHSSITNNDRGADVNIMYLQAGNARIYNNTFSGNACKSSIVIGNSSSMRYVYNNTLWNSGGMEISSSTSAGSFRFMNNIVTGSSTVTAVIGNSVTINNTNFTGNIFNQTFYTNGMTATADISSTFLSDFSTALTRHPAPGKQVHQLLNPQSNSHCMERGGTIATLNGAVLVALDKDQLGVARYDGDGNIALGAVDRSHISTIDPQIVIEGSEWNEIALQPRTIDLSTLVQAPADAGALSFELLGQMAPVGILSNLTGSQTTFTPATHVPFGTNTFAYRVRDASGKYTDIGYITITLRYDGNPPGYTDPADFNTCFAYMGAVNFTSAYRFITSYEGTGTGDVPDGWTGGKLNTDDNRMQGFSIPLVADLDHDGYPEIIGLGAPNSMSTSLTGQYNNIQIYNGRTGKLYSKMTWPGTAAGTYTHGAFHGSPAPMTLVDSDRDGIVELIMAFPDGGGSTSYQCTLASFNLTPQKTNGVTTSYTMTEKWHNTTKYNLGGSTGIAAQNSYEKPVPTVVDLDGDGEPEVVVYNKIYNARTGALLLTLESLNSTAHVGSDINAYSNDKYVGFNFVYDMDLDGIYDVVAGGRVYKITKPGGSFSYTTITMAGVPDGRTGVADINGDGKPDVVTVARPNALSSNSDDANKIRIVVWNPFPSPQIIADLTYVHRGWGDSGSNSYVYIGDINGVEQVVDGKTYRLPEIAILAGEYRYGSNTNVSHHPGVTGLPSSGTSSKWGDLVAFTWDAANGLTASQRLKLSFILEHEDQSNNTGFTMFDFDNDGMQEICYRDEQTLRIIKATVPYVPVSYTNSNHPEVILFSRSVQSYTGFEYPVIADIDNDASAEMVVMGHKGDRTRTRGYIYAVGNSSGDKFAPALPVWNQFMYDPFKIKPDSLTTPIGPAINRLDTSFTFKREIKNESNQVIKTIEKYQPFNGTLLQAPYFTGIETTADANPNFEPIVFLTEAYIVDNDASDIAKRPVIYANPAKDSVYIQVYIGNHETAKTDISPNTPVIIYRNNKVSQTTVVMRDTLKNLWYEIPPGSGVTTVFNANTISPGQEFCFFLKFPGSEEDVFIVSLGDDSYLPPVPGVPIWRWGLNEDPDSTLSDPDHGTGVARRQFRDCYWPDQRVRVARYQVVDDAQTVQEFRSVEIDIWGNDILPDAFFTGLANPMDSVTIHPKAGYLTYSGTGRDGRMEYYHDGRVELTNGVDSFHYRITFWDTTRNQYVTDSAAVYIYVLESAAGGFSFCYGASATIVLADKPPGQVSFNWFDETGETYLGAGFSRTIQGVITGDSVYQVQPRITPDPYNVEFPKGTLAVSLVTKSQSAVTTMRWTGLVNSNWRNPDNWVEVKGTYEAPVSWAPAGCVNVIISSGTVYYPELIDSAVCLNITIKDRALLKNPHVLTYDSAQVEIKLKPSERDRFVMWSAPLRGMYSGDYHFKNNANPPGPQWGDVRMNYFQQANPAGGVAQENAFTATFGSPAESLGLGKPFNLYVFSTTQSKDRTWVFPQPDKQYEDVNGGYYPLNRTNGYKFITHGTTLLPDTTFALPLVANAGMNLVQVVNPYLAYLDVGKFLQANNTSLAPGGYLIWDGKLDNSFIGAKIDTSGNRYTCTTNPSLSLSPNLIPPLQSFFVQKLNKSVDLASVWMSPNWTTTSGERPYTLRAAEPEYGVLRVKAVQGGRTSYAVLYYDPAAEAGYHVGEDVQSLFYDEIPLTLYSLTSRQQPLAINSSGDFQSQPVALGMRVKESGEMQLEFSGLDHFGHNVYLIDREKNVTTDLQATPSYTFVLSKPSSSGTTEINDRFALQMEYTGRGWVGNRPAITPDALTVSSENGELHVRASSGTIRELYVYNISGALVHASRMPSDAFRIPVDRQQVYVVKARLGETYEVRKTYVK
jgi:hypothetical protein